MDISEFIAARLDEDEATARGAIWQRWTWDGHQAHVDTAEPVPHHLLGDKPARVANCHSTTGKVESEARHAAHIARWDPARVLAEVEAKRGQLGLAQVMREQVPLTGYTGLLDLADLLERQLAAPYADHTDYDLAWKIEP